MPSLQPTIQPKLDDYTMMGTISTIGSITGSAIMATGVILILTARQTKPKQPAITPVLGLEFIGAEGRF